MAKILTEPQNDHSIKIKRIKTKTNPKMWMSGFGYGALKKEGMVYDDRLDAVRIGTECIPMSNIAVYELEE